MSPQRKPRTTSRINLAHLDHLSDEVVHDGETIRWVHLYADAPAYQPVGDAAEGVACVDDVARAAVVYLRHFETTGDCESQGKAEGLLRFVMHMQQENGLFHNFVLNKRLQVNRTHLRSRADAVHWWAARGLWALATGASILGDANAEFARQCAERARRTVPHLLALLDHYPQTSPHHGRTVPQWLIQGHAADATSEAILGLTMLQRVEPDPRVATLLERFGEGIALMRYGSMNEFPFGAHASAPGLWHGWGNSQTQALAEAGLVTLARPEAEQFYPRLLVEGWRHSMTFDEKENTRPFERIAYAVRCVAVGLIRLFEATGEDRFAVMAGLAASWLTGNNAAGQPMYDPATGRGYDGIDEQARINHNSGAESTIEALYTLIEVERHPAACEWLDATGDPLVRKTHDGEETLHRIFHSGAGATGQRVALVMNLTTDHLHLLRGGAVDALDG
ncbi:MAG: hypothetical protein IID37_05405 [Planctomycetes bacterium]|nr:hypothetical protein [Planctomycetota bacterium]